MCAPLWVRAPSRARAQRVMHTAKFWQLSSRNHQNVSRNITLHGDARDQFWVSILSSMMSKCSFINTHITLLLFECEYKANFFYWKDKATQISVRIRCMFAKHSGRFSIGQTGKISPRSMVQPQQIHLVPLEHTTQFRDFPSGLFMGLSWCLEPGRIGFVLSS